MNVVSHYFSLGKQAVGFLKFEQRPFSNIDAYNISLITNILYTSTLCVLALRGLRTLRVRTRAFGPRLEKSKKPLIFDICGITFFTTHIHHMLLIISYSQSAYPITPV